MEAGLWEGEQGCERSARELLVVMEPYHDCITEHPGCAAALQDVIIGGNGYRYDVVSPLQELDVLNSKQ